MKSVSPNDRVKSYPDEYFNVCSNKLFCQACREEICLKKSVIDNHIKSVKHANSKLKVAARESRTMEITESLKRYDSSVHPKGETLPDCVRVYRVRVVAAFLKAGIPISKIDSFRDSLEEGGYSLSDRSNLAELIPFINQEELN